MNPAFHLFLSLLFTGLIGASIVACIMAARNFSAPQPPCRRCTHSHDAHEPRFGTPGVCRDCLCFRYERP